uniref:RING-type E3 ubiquitin transferase n=1 Tax=Candidozyma auris TaxID=498019 RepID=A0A0L0P3A7_CANAR
MHPEEIGVATKLLYFFLTTLIGARTLGEEYVDLMYVNRSGRRLPRFIPRLGFILLYALLPYVVTRIVKKLKARHSAVESKDESWYKKILTSYPKLLDTIINIHVAIFYFEGSFYSISKRIFGLRYVFGHNKDPKKLARTGNYSALGVIILLQFAIKVLIKLKEYSDENSKTEEEKNMDRAEANSYDTFRKLQQLETLREHFDDDIDDKVNIDLSNPNELPYLPESARSCMLCLSPMVNPCAANCGHMFCWDCIVDWTRQHPECPLCRQVCLEQNLLPLR